MLNSRKSKTYLLYTIVFFFTFFGCFFYYILSGKSFLWSNDGVNLYIKKIIEYSNDLKCFLHDLLFDGKITISMWKFCMGEGTDAMQTLEGHAIGDPFILFSVFFNEKNMIYYYSIFQCIRLYLVGFAFILLCKRYRISDDIGVIIGAIIYTFCGWCLFNAQRHYTFLNFCIYFPLLLIGADKIFKNERPYIYIFMIFIMFCNSAYFMWQVVIVFIIYVITKLICSKNSFKYSVLILIKFLTYSMIGTLLSSYLLLSNVVSLLNERRAGSGAGVSLFYDRVYYEYLLRSFISWGEKKWTILAYSGTALIAIFSIFFNNIRSNFIFKVWFILGYVFLCFPIFGKIFNGGGYVTNRWIWVFSLLIAYMVSYNWENVVSMSMKSFTFITITLILYTILCSKFKNSLNFNVLFQIILSYGCVFLLYLSLMHYQYTKWLLLMLTSFSVMINSYFLNSKNESNYANQAIPYQAYENVLFNTETSVLKNMTYDEKDYFRYQGNDKYANNALLARMHGTSYYTSNTNKYLQDFFCSLGICRSHGHKWEGYDYKTMLYSLLNIKYIVSNKTNTLPFGYKLYNTNGNLNIYKSEYSLPLIYKYEMYTDKNDFDKLNFVEKQEVMIDTAVVKNYSGNCANKNQDIKFSNVKLDFNVSNLTNVSIDSDYAVAMKDKAVIKLNVKTIPNSETHIIIKNFDFVALHEYDLYFNKDYAYEDEVYYLDLSNNYDPCKLSKKSINKLKLSKSEFGFGTNRISIDFSSAFNNLAFIYNNKYSTGYANYHDFDINLGYCENEYENIIITLPKKGIYMFDSFDIFGLPMENFKNNILKLVDDEITNIRTEGNSIYFDSSSDAGKFVCCAMPYYDGWKAYVDGKETKIYITNIRHMGIDIPAGTHKVEFRYTNYYLVYGSIVSFISFIGFIIFIIINEKKLKLKKKCHRK